MVRYKNIGDKEYQNCKDVDNLTNNTNEEFNKYKNVLIGDIIKFGLNRFHMYKKMKYNVMALEV